MEIRNHFLVPKYSSKYDTTVLMVSIYLNNRVFVEFKNAILYNNKKTNPVSYWNLLKTDHITDVVT